MIMTQLRSASHRRRLQTQPAAWSPALPTTGGAVSPAHWYRSDDAYQDAARTTPCTGDGDAVGSLTAKTANADHVSQATAANQPTWQNGAGDQVNGHPVLRFDGSDDGLVGSFTTGGTISQALTVIAVAKLDPSAVNDGLNHWLFNDDSASFVGLFTAAGPTPDAWSIHGGAQLNGGATDSDWHIWTVLFKGGSSQYWKDGVSEASGNAGGNSIAALILGEALAGGSGPWKGDLVEFLIYAGELSDADKNQLGAYAAGRYALSYTEI